MEPILLGLVVVFVGTGSFMIGRLSVAENSRPEVRICEKDNTALLSAETHTEALGTNSGETGIVAAVASKNGTKYHLPTCPGAKQISPANLISFSSIASARAAGLTPASNCPGLE
jgi:hypothetical protein